MFACDFEASVGIGGFAALADGDESVICGDNGGTVTIFACDVDVDGDASEFFDEVFTDESGVIACSASDDLESSTIFEV